MRFLAEDKFLLSAKVIAHRAVEALYKAETETYKHNASWQVTQAGRAGKPGLPRAGGGTEGQGRRLAPKQGPDPARLLFI